MSRRVSFWGGLSLSLLMLGGCLLADVGIDQQIDDDVDRAIASAQGAAGAGGAGGPSGAGGNSGSGATPTGSGGGGNGGTESIPQGVIAPSGAAGSASLPGGASAGSAGSAGTGSMPANTAGAGGSGAVVGFVPDAADACPATTEKEAACFSYCRLFTDVCQDFVAAGGLRPYDYSSDLDCVDKCNAEDNTWEVGTIASGNTVLCRCAHSFLAESTGNRGLHCFHAAQFPTGMCL